MKRCIIPLLMLALLGSSTHAALQRKVYDPLEPIQRTVPPNILLVVDNSGSMNLDTNNSEIMDFRSLHMVWAGTGDYWHYNLPLQSSWNLVPNSTCFDAYGENINRTLSTVPTSTTVSVSGQTDDTTYVAIALDVWMPVTMDRSDAGISITLSRNGVSKTIQPVDQWYTFAKSTGDPNQIDERCCDGSAYCPDDERCRRYRVTYAFKEFKGMDPNGGWTVSITSTSSHTITLDAVYLTFSPLLSKITILKTALQELIVANSDIRIALGSYKATWRSACSYPTCYIFNPDGTYLPGSYYVWWVDSTDPGLGLCSQWPADGLETDTNHADLLDWVGLNDTGTKPYNNISDETHELMGRGYTPIESCFKDIYSGLTGADGTLSSIAYSSDIYQSCRNYAVIFLTDGQCTENNCSNENIQNKILDIYHSHELTTGTGITVGTHTYIVGLSMTDTDRAVLNTWADAGDDGLLNNTGFAYMPTNAVELTDALADAIQKASAQQVAINSDVIFGTVDPDKALPYNPLFGTKTVTLTDENGTSTGTETVMYPAVDGNIMFTTLIFYPTWEGTLTAYQPMYKRIVSGGTDITDESNLFYFPNGQYPVLWDAHTLLGKRLDGEMLSDGTHVNGIRDALGETVNTPTAADSPVWRKILLVDPQDPSSLISLTQFSFDTAQGKWRPATTLASLVAGKLFGGDIAKGEAFVTFMQSRQLADITYSTPALVGEPEMGFEEWSASYFQFKIDKRNTRIPVVLVGANDGMLHAFNAYNGKEEWSVIPVGVLTSLKQMFENYDPISNPTGQTDLTQLDYLGRTSHIYGVASSPKVVDVNTTYSTDTETWRTLTVCGLGAGGNAYFALDVTDTMDPQPRWDTSTNSDFSDMGESWSYPALWQILVDPKSGPEPPRGFPAGFFTSGYSSDSGKGKQLYVINLADGSLMTKQTPTGISADAFLLGAPAGIMDSSQQYMKGAYFCDTAGGVYRYMFGDTPCKTFQTPSATTILSCPAVYRDTNNIEWVSFGELGFEDKANNIFANRSALYTFKFDTCTETKDLVDMSTFLNANGTNTTVPLEGKDGYFLQLDQNEVLMTNPLTTQFYYEDDAGVLQTQTVSIFISYHYPESGDYCGQGESEMYIFGVSSLFVGDSEGDGDLGTIIGEGRPGNPVKTGITGTVWINTQEGPIRILPLEDNVDSAPVPLYFPFSGVDARKLGAGAWLVK